MGYCRSRGSYSSVLASSTNSTLDWGADCTKISAHTMVILSEPKANNSRLVVVEPVLLVTNGTTGLPFLRSNVFSLASSIALAEVVIKARK